MSFSNPFRLGECGSAQSLVNYGGCTLVAVACAGEPSDQGLMRGEAVDVRILSRVRPSYYRSGSCLTSFSPFVQGNEIPSTFTRKGGEMGLWTCFFFRPLSAPPATET